MLRVSVDTVRRERKRQRLGHVKVGRRIFVTENQLSEYLENQRIDPCHESAENTRAKSVNTGSQSGLPARHGAGPGSISAKDRQAAHLLAQATFRKQN